MCGQDLDCSEIDPMTNIQKNMFPLFTEAQQLITMLMTADPKTDDDSVEMVGKVFQRYGAIVSLLIGFDKTF